MSVPATASGIHLASDESTERVKSSQTFELNRNSIFLAENESKPADSESQSINENKNQAPSSDATDGEKSGKSPDDAETKPIKPFKPSEEIAAEQAVDYPVDI